MKIKVETLRIRKTPTKQRGTYTYVTAEGCKIVLHPGEQDVTEVHIKMLHSMDDAEVYNNIKNARPEPTAEEKQQISVPFGWLGSVGNYISVLHDCSGVSADDYYLAWKAVTDNTSPMIRTVKVLEVTT